MSTPARSQVLRMPPGWVAAAAAAVGFLAAGLLWGVVQGIRGELVWTATQVIGTVMLSGFVLIGVPGVVLLWRHRLWVDYARNELHLSAGVLGTAAIPLDAPTTIALRSAAVRTSMVRGGAYLVVRAPDFPTIKLHTPGVPSIGAVLAILAPALARNPDLPADEETRRALVAAGG